MYVVQLAVLLFIQIILHLHNIIIICMCNPSSGSSQQYNSAVLLCQTAMLVFVVILIL